MGFFEPFFRERTEMKILMNIRYNWNSITASHNVTVFGPQKSLAVHAQIWKPYLHLMALLGQKRISTAM